MIELIWYFSKISRPNWSRPIPIPRLPWWLSSKESVCNAGDTGDTGSILGSRRSPGGGHGNPLQYSCLENPMDRGAWLATVHGVTKSQTWLKQLSMHACTGDSGISWLQVVWNFLGYHLQFHLSDCTTSPHSLPGTNVHEAQNILSNSGLPITSAVDLEDAAKKAVASVAKKWCLALIPWKKCTYP